MADRPAFAVSLADTASGSSEAIIEILEDGNEQRAVVVVDTIEEAIARDPEVVILRAERDRETSEGTLEGLRNHKVIGIGYGAAQLFGHLGLEINDGACAHDPDNPPRISLSENTLIGHSGSPESLVAFELPRDAQGGDVNFAMYTPERSHLCSVVEVVARWTGDEDYGPIVRQGNHIMIGLDAPPLTWTPPYRTLFKDLSEAMYARELEPFARVEWPIAPPGTYQIHLGTTDCTEDVHHFRFSEPTTFTAHLEHHGSKHIALLFMGENREHWTRKDTSNAPCRVPETSGQVEADDAIPGYFDESPLEISIDITDGDILSVGERYWTLTVANYDSEHAADCRLETRY